MPTPDGEVTLLLTELRAGNQEAANQFMPLIYGELRRIAGSYMPRERRGHTLQATALVNEVYMRLAGGGPADRIVRIFAIAAHAMRDILLDYARRHSAARQSNAWNELIRGKAASSSF